MRSSLTNRISDSDVSDDGTSARKHTQRGRNTINGLATTSTPLRRTSNVATEGVNNIASAISAKARRSFEDLGAAFRSGATGIREEVREEVHDAAAEVSTISTQVKRTARRSVSQVEKRTHHAFVRARAFLSDAKHLATILVILEAIVLVAHITPSTTIRLGRSPARTLVKQATSAGKATPLPQITLTIPNLWVLLSYQFWRPVLLWSAWTVVLPIIAANFITFDRKHEPSTLTFTLIRLAILSLASKVSLFASKPIPQVVGVAAGEIRQASASLLGSLTNQVRASISYDFVAPFLSVDVQILATSLAAAFAAYEVVSHRR